MFLTKNFSQDECSCHCGCGLWKMNAGFMRKVQKLRDICGFALPINSGIRCESHNLAIKGHPTSAHLTGEGIDIRVDREKARIVIKNAIELGFEGVGIAQQGEGRFVHLDDKKRKNGKAVWTYS